MAFQTLKSHHIELVSSFPTASEWSYSYHCMDSTKKFYIFTGKNFPGTLPNPGQYMFILENDGLLSFSDFEEQKINQPLNFKMDYSWMQTHILVKQLLKEALSIQMLF